MSRFYSDAYKWSLYEKHEQELRPAIKEICDENFKRPGSENIRQQLMSQGFTVSKRKVLKLLHEIDPQLPRQQKGAKIDWQSSDANLLARQFSQPAPNMAWVSDITEFNTDTGTYYLCAILDLFSRRIIGARLSPHKDTSLVLSTFRDEFDSRGYPSDLDFLTLCNFSDIFCGIGFFYRNLCRIIEDFLIKS